MVRNLLRFLVLVLIIAFVRYLFVAIRRAFSETRQAARDKSGRPVSKEASGGELIRDPVCGTYVAASTAVKQVVGGKTLHFCSTKCRDKYQPS